MDIRAPRDGKAIEELGIVDPLAKESTEQVRLNEQRIKYWLSVGAQPSQTVRSLLRKAGILPAEPPAKRKPANNKPQA
jgi:small subunit ribosomal protein S16